MTSLPAMRRRTKGVSRRQSAPARASDLGQGLSS
jgi:hypothetical protein